jgi:hypothetical protein
VVEAGGEESVFGPRPGVTGAKRSPQSPSISTMPTRMSPPKAPKVRARAPPARGESSVTVPRRVELVSHDKTLEPVAVQDECTYEAVARTGGAGGRGRAITAMSTFALSTFGFQPAIVPSSVAKRKTAGPDLPFFEVTKSVEVWSSVLNACLSGAPTAPGPAEGGAGIATWRGCVLPAPS